MDGNNLRIVYQIAILDNFINASKNNSYIPDDFDTSGFIYCTGEPETTLLVLEDYFGQVINEILLLRIAKDKLISPIKFEDPAPLIGGGTSHIKQGVVFPHIYGPLNLDAITGAAIVNKKSGKFVWPDIFGPLVNILK
jgi:uncharacterized protein (DUF952 family)